VYCIQADSQLLQPILHECLAQPCALALAPDGSTLYVAELLRNRVLRLSQRPAGVYVP
jgi:sugar lactone lactonase YvrE